MPVLLLLRSLTQAQRGLRILQNNGIPASVAKAPAGAVDKGCAYGIRLPMKRADAALRVLERAEISVIRVIRLDPDGTFTEVHI